MLEPDAPFYLSVNHFKTLSYHKLEDCFWFKAQPMGINKLDSIMKEMCKAAKITLKTNHAGRKTLVQKLQDNGVPAKQIIQVTGHKNIQSINNYSQLGEKQQENISKILSSSNSSATDVTGMGNLQCTYQSSSLSTFSAIDENQLQTMFYSNTITGATFNINMASSQTASAASPSNTSSVKKVRRVMTIESDSSQENE